MILIREHDMLVQLEEPLWVVCERPEDLREGWYDDNLKPTFPPEELRSEEEK